MRKWTVLVYMAGDTGVVFEGPMADEQLFAELEGPMQADLAKMKEAGSNDDVAVCVQFDSLAAQQSFRWIVPRKDDPAPAGPQPIGQVNTGEPASLSDFAGWAVDCCPAEHYALVIWGHGTGWDEKRLYGRYPQARQSSGGDRADLRGTLTRRGIFASTQARILSIRDDGTRGLCYDDSSRDFLDNAELQAALKDAAVLLKVPRIELLCLDACLMSMVEVAYQIRGEAAYLLASEAVAPGSLWPWADILARLQTAPDLSPAKVATTIVDRIAAAPAADDFTTAVLSLGCAEPVAALLDRWARLILSAYDDDYVRSAIRTPIWPGAGEEACLRLPLPGLEQSDYVDLYDLVRLFVENWTGELAGELLAAPQGGPPASWQDELRQVSRDLLRRLTPGDTALVVRNLASGMDYAAKAHGVSIYLPCLDTPGREGHEISPQYGHLPLADTAWPELICRLNGQDVLPAAFLAVRDDRRERRAATFQRRDEQ